MFRKAILGCVALVAAMLVAGPAGAGDHRLSGKTRRTTSKTTDSGGVLTQTDAFELDGGIWDAETGERAAEHLTFTLTVKTLEASLQSVALELVRHVGRQPTPTTLDLTDEGRFVLRGWANDPSSPFTAESFAFVAGKLLQGLVTPCGIHVLEGFLADAVSQALLPVAKGATGAVPQGTHDHELSGQTRRTTLTTDEGGVRTEVHSYELDGVIRDQQTGESEPAHFTVGLHVQRQGTTLLSMTVRYARDVGGTVSVEESVIPCGIQLAKDTQFTAESFAHEAVAALQAQLDQVIIPCGVHVMEGFFADAASRAVLPLVVTGGL